MKIERHWLIFKRQVPENDWEAKYLAKQYETSNWSTAVLMGIFALCLAIMVLSINLHPCEAEFEGSVSGIFDFNTKQFPESAVNEFVINNGEGKIKVSGSCSAVALFSARNYR